MKILQWVAAAVALAGAWGCERVATADADGVLTPGGGERIAIIGNTLAERMQHHGYLETLIQQRFAEAGLSLRHLGWSADEVALRPRERDFGSPDDYLHQVGADVVLAFFGFNESFAGEAGLPDFRDELARLIEHKQQQSYNGESPPRLVLISPIAAEAGHVDEAETARLNERLATYSEAMGEVAEAHGVGFVDLFTPTRRMFGEAERPLTINGIHLSDDGYRELAPLLMRGLFGDGDDLAEPEFNERLRREIVARNDVFFYGYRPVNGYYIYGGRSQLRHEPDTSWTNADEMEREREIWRAMADHHDGRIHALARGEDVPEQVEYDDLPSLFEIETNYPGEIEYLYGEDALASFSLPEGYRIELFASEQEFAELANPMAMSFDGEGRLWVLTMPLFPQRRPDQQLQGRLLVLEDENGDGRADAMTVFADDLHIPTGFALGDGGAYVANQHDLLFFKDTSGDGRADVRERVLHGFGTADSHHANSAFVWGPGGGLYMMEGVFHRSAVETPTGPRRLRDGGVWRYVPQRHELEVFIEYIYPNPWGHVFDRWGMNIVMDATGPDSYHAGGMSVRSVQEAIDGDPPGAATEDWVANRAPHFDVGVRPNGGAELISSRHFPEASQGNYLVSNVVGFHGIREFRLTVDGAGIGAEHVRDLVTSSDPNFRPIDMEIGPDGALYLTDWHSRLIGHMTHSLRDPSRDQKHGRIYRIVHEDRPLLEPEPTAGRSVAKLLELLKSAENRTIYNARRELREHDDEAVFAALADWRGELDADDAEYERHLLEALWLHQSRGVRDEALIERLLRTEDFRARAAATRVLRHWAQDVADAAALLEQQAGDEHPRVRLEAVVGASFLDADAARRVLATAEERQVDAHLAYAIGRVREIFE